MTKKEASIEYRKKLKTQILDTANDMFRHNGLKAVKMDDISHALGISKRTLYEIYPNKEDLVCEAVKSGFENSRQKLLSRISDSSDTMDILIEFFKIRIEEFQDTSETFLDDIQLYPKIKDFFERHKEDHANRVLKFFQRGKDEGYFLPVVNMQMISEINSVISTYFISSRQYLRYESKDVLRGFIVLFVRSICTMKGIERIDQLLETL